MPTTFVLIFIVISSHFTMLQSSNYVTNITFIFNKKFFTQAENESKIQLITTKNQNTEISNSVLLALLLCKKRQNHCSLKNFNINSHQIVLR